MKLKITHTTRYAYDQPVKYGLQQLRLTPVNSVQQTVLDWQIAVEGGSIELEFDDHFGNKTSLVQVESARTSIEVSVTGEVETHDTAGILGKVYGNVPLWHYLQSTTRTKPGKHLRRLSRLIGKHDSTLEGLHGLSQAIIEMAPYHTDKTEAGTTAEEAMELGGGVCQDHSQAFVSAARVAGIPARYVSGYLMMNDRVDQDASHAWAEAYVQELGWVGFDVSNRISPDERYVRLATGLDSKEAAPMSGIRRGGASESMIVSLQVQQ